MVRAKTITERAVDNFTSNVETLLIAVQQRPMTEQQVFRLGRILDENREQLLARSTSSPVVDRKTASARPSTRSKRRAA